MIRGLTTSVSGMLADERMMQALSNNLANMNTPGFKSSDGMMMSFPEQLVQLANSSDRASQPLGVLGTGTVFQEGVPEFSQGAVSQTGRSLDVAIVDSNTNPTSGPSSVTTGSRSFFAVSYQAPTGVTGVALTRDGHFAVNAKHQLIDSNGNAVIPVDANGHLVPGDRIVLNPNYQGTTLFTSNGRPVVDAQGNPSFEVVNVNGKPVSGMRLGVVNANVTSLSPLGRGEFMVGKSLNAASTLSAVSTGTGTIVPGELEQSNVNETQTLTSMLPILQQYQANQQALQDTAQTLSNAVTDVGRVQI